MWTSCERARWTPSRPLSPQVIQAVFFGVCVLIDVSSLLTKGGDSREQERQLRKLIGLRDWMMAVLAFPVGAVRGWMDGWMDATNRAHTHTHKGTIAQGTISLFCRNQRPDLCICRIIGSLSHPSRSLWSATQMLIQGDFALWADTKKHLSDQHVDVTSVRLCYIQT